MFKRKLDERTYGLRRTNTMMEEKIGERTRDLANALERARDADRIKSAFLATMSHGSGRRSTRSSDLPESCSRGWPVL